jgi:hypothetical protein
LRSPLSEGLILKKGTLPYALGALVSTDMRLYSELKMGGVVEAPLAMGLALL